MRESTGESYKYVMYIEGKSKRTPHFSFWNRGKYHLGRSILAKSYVPNDTNDKIYINPVDKRKS